MIIIRSFKTEIYPNKYQRQICSQFLGNNRFIYNSILNIYKTTPVRRIVYSTKKETNKNVSIYSPKGVIQILKEIEKGYSFLKLSHSHSKQEMAKRVAKAYVKYMEKEKVGEPKFKKKNKDESFYISNQGDSYKFLNEKQISLTVITTKLKKLIKEQNPSLNKKDIENLTRINVKKAIPFFIRNNTNILSFRIKKSNGRYFLTIVYSYENYIEKQEYTEEEILKKRVVGCDLGFKDKIILSNGKKFKPISKTKEYIDYVEEKKKKQRELAKKVEARKLKYIKKRKTISEKKYNKLKKTRRRNRYANKIKDDILKYKVVKENKFSKEDYKEIYSSKKIKAKTKQINKITKKLTNMNRNQNHHISKYIADNFDFIAMETLNIKGLQKMFGKTILDLALYELLSMIKYKAESQGKIFIQIDKWFPSSKLCSTCHMKYKQLSLNEREWTCSHCGTKHDRDINACMNILEEGLRLYYSGKESNPPQPSLSGT